MVGWGWFRRNERTKARKKGRKEGWKDDMASFWLLLSLSLPHSSSSSQYDIISHILGSHFCRFLPWPRSPFGPFFSLSHSLCTIEFQVEPCRTAFSRALISMACSVLGSSYLVHIVSMGIQRVLSKKDGDGAGVAVDDILFFYFGLDGRERMTMKHQKTKEREI
jgi:hypothetical protein